MHKTLYLLRGDKGSGKEKLSRTLLHTLPNCAAISIDSYFEDGGEYKFKSSDAPEAYQACFDSLDTLMEKNRENIVVRNSNAFDDLDKQLEDLAHENYYSVVKLLVG